MSSDSSSTTKVLVGCLIAFVVCVLVCSGAIILVGYWGVGVVREAARQMPVVLENLELIELAETWEAPAADAGPDTLFPAKTGAWALSGHDDEAVIPELAIERDGLHATYESAGKTIDVYAYRVPAAEQAEVFSAAIRAIDDAPYTVRSRENTDLGTAHWMQFSVSPPERQGRLWWKSGWLIVIMTDTSALNLDGIAKSYLKAIQPPLESERFESYSQPDLNDPAVTDPPDEPPAPSISERQAQ